MEYPPQNWEVFPEDDFELAVPRDPGPLGAEMMAQVRGNGRIQDHVRLVLGGSDLMEKVLPVSTMINRVGIPAWRIKLSVWPRDVSIRRNMATSPWQDLRDLVTSGELEILADDDREVSNDSFFEVLDQGGSKTKEKTSASLRWAVAIGEDHRLRLELQSLPASTSTINSKPLLKG